MLVRTHMQDLKDVTRETHYENYRAHCIQSMTRMVVKERNRKYALEASALQMQKTAGAQICAFGQIASVFEGVGHEKCTFPYVKDKPTWPRLWRHFLQFHRIPTQLQPMAAVQASLLQGCIETNSNSHSHSQLVRRVYVPKYLHTVAGRLGCTVDCMQRWMESLHLDVWVLPEVSRDWMLSNVAKPTTLDYKLDSKLDQKRQNEH